MSVPQHPKHKSTLLSLIYLLGAICFITAIWTLLISENFESVQNVFINFSSKLTPEDFKSTSQSGRKFVSNSTNITRDQVMDKTFKERLFQDEIESMQNIPIRRDGEFKKINENLLPFESKCGQRPSLLDIEISYTYWQTMRTRRKPESTLIFLYGAYVDTRVEPPVVRLLADSYDLLNSTEMGQPEFCQFWYSGINKPVVVKMENVTYVWDERWGKNGHYHPYLLTCELPRLNTVKDKSKDPLTPLEIPESVSVVGEKCERSTNDVKITYNVPEVKEDFGVCVKGVDLSADDFSIRFIEWIEMIGILGASKIHFHLFDAHPNLYKVLKYYESKEKITLKKFTLPGFQPNLPMYRNKYLYSGAKLTVKRRQEVIAYNDCFYTHMYSYKYIAVIDFDEVIISKQSKSWKKMIQELDIDIADTKRVSPCFQMMLFVDKIVKKDTDIVYATAPNIPDQIEGYPYMLNKLNYELKTTCNGGGVRGVKCLHSTDNVLIVHNHRPRVCLNGPCSRDIKNTIAYTHHHKESCYKDGHNETLIDQPFGYDPTILRYKKKLISRRDEVMLDLQL